ncbi:hypothetical protein [Rivihabitans pingtungensis]|uniref:GIY-YIG domain-containing protein n=1 Tax=Rivihabitans pingtungensis TaxID=1054498 RepID=A0A318KXA7_9NEIS|nr:hypothetical protein [Rivihabitans pingtungensis]PXX81202.1 hypothetical protein DFR34_10237 [Rivihabitans pingtungensis]
MFTPKYFNVHWYGPYVTEEAGNLTDPNLVLYMICGTHGMYGKNVPLYIGKTIRSITQRLKEHDWINREPDPVQIYAAAISKPFLAWDELKNEYAYPAPENQIIEEIESLIIFAHQPVYNTRSKGGRQSLDHDFVVFNTGRRSTLLPEVSSMYWYG